jgi:hypothetical protein
MVGRNGKRRVYISQKDCGPHPVKRVDLPANDGWFYVNPGSVDVCAYVPGIGTTHVKLSKKQIAMAARLMRI